MHNTFRLRQSHLAEMFRNWNLENEMFEWKMIEYEIVGGL
jgi:hypothetical protein